eukprot:GHVP01002135.1.p1 GENE.GHVP01002135.1~~GHVP01002135.1.p1  ORF type:complete len:868 (+),score=170.85 GHVP01002135.1:44-2605(+)
MKRASICWVLLIFPVYGTLNVHYSVPDVTIQAIHHTVFFRERDLVSPQKTLGVCDPSTFPYCSFISGWSQKMAPSLQPRSFYGNFDIRHVYKDIEAATSDLSVPITHNFDDHRRGTYYEGPKRTLSRFKHGNRDFDLLRHETRRILRPLSGFTSAESFAAEFRSLMAASEERLAPEKKEAKQKLTTREKRRPRGFIDTVQNMASMFFRFLQGSIDDNEIKSTIPDFPSRIVHPRDPGKVKNTDEQVDDKEDSEFHISWTGVSSRSLVSQIPEFFNTLGDFVQSSAKLLERRNLEPHAAKLFPYVAQGNWQIIRQPETEPCLFLESLSGSLLWMNNPVINSIWFKTIEKPEILPRSSERIQTSSNLRVKAYDAVGAIWEADLTINPFQSTEGNLFDVLEIPNILRINKIDLEYTVIDNSSYSICLSGFEGSMLFEEIKHNYDLLPRMEAFPDKESFDIEMNGYRDKLNVGPKNVLGLFVLPIKEEEAQKSQDNATLPYSSSTTYHQAIRKSRFNILFSNDANSFSYLDKKLVEPDSNVALTFKTADNSVLGSDIRPPIGELIFFTVQIPVENSDLISYSEALALEKVLSSQVSAGTLVSDVDLNSFPFYTRIKDDSMSQLLQEEVAERILDMFLDPLSADSIDVLERDDMIKQQVWDLVTNFYVNKKERHLASSESETKSDTDNFVVKLMSFAVGEGGEVKTETTEIDMKTIFSMLEEATEDLKKLNEQPDRESDRLLELENKDFDESKENSDSDVIEDTISNENRVFENFEKKEELKNENPVKSFSPSRAATTETKVFSTTKTEKIDGVVGLEEILETAKNEMMEQHKKIHEEALERAKEIHRQHSSKDHDEL